MNESDSEEPRLHEIPQEAANDDNDRSQGEKPLVIEDSTDDDGEDHTPKRRRTESVEDDKKLQFRTDYESFSMNGWVLCLLITRRDVKGKSRVNNNVSEGETNRQALMEEWISTAAEGNPDED